jgi:hypothetical protein
MNVPFTGVYLGYRYFYLVTRDSDINVQFSGSGITLYAVVVNALTFTVGVDGGSPATHHFDGVWNCCLPPIQPAYNFTIYDIQSLPLDNHILNVTHQCFRRLHT